jgi:hypothetical protein
MLKLVALLFTMLLLPRAEGAECTGTTEQLLECHAPEVKALLSHWVRAWGDGDIETYLSLYASARSPRQDMTRETWEAHRRARIGPGKQVELNLKLQSMGIENSGLIDVVFEQHYKSATYEDVVTKRIFLIQQAGELKIWKEDLIP